MSWYIYHSIHSLLHSLLLDIARIERHQHDHYNWAIRHHLNNSRCEKHIWDNEHKKNGIHRCMVNPTMTSQTMRKEERKRTYTSVLTHSPVSRDHNLREESYEPLIIFCSPIWKTLLSSLFSSISLTSRHLTWLLCPIIVLLHPIDDHPSDRSMSQIYIVQ